jgi:hypothetical protein
MATGAAGSTAMAKKAWGLPLFRLADGWTRFERWLCTLVLLLEVFALTVWVALEGLSTGREGPAAGILFRALVGAIVLGAGAWWALAKRAPTTRRIACVACVLVGALGAGAWSNAGVDWSSNVLNWFQQASTLTLVGGLRGFGTRLTLLLALLGGSLATAAGKHITIDLVTRYLKPALRLPIATAGWTLTACVCLTAAWGFFDHISIEDFGANRDASVIEKVASVRKGVADYAFATRKQLVLDFKSLPHVLRGEAYGEWLRGEDWNHFLDEAGFVERWGREKVEALRIPAGARRAPIVVIPGEGEPRGGLTHVANLVFPIGLLIIGLRFVLLSLLAWSGHFDLDGEAHAGGLERI